MSKEYVKGVTIGESKVVEDTVQQEAEVREYETGEEDTKALIRANEEDCCYYVGRYSVAHPKIGCLIG